jgi:hypothetical protein
MIRPVWVLQELGLDMEYELFPGPGAKEQACWGT